MTEHVAKVTNETILFSRHARMIQLGRMRKSTKRLTRINAEFEKEITKATNGIETMKKMTEDNFLDILGGHLPLRNTPNRRQKSSNVNKPHQPKKKRAYNSMMMTDRTEGGPVAAKYTTDHLKYMRHYQYDSILPLLLGFKEGEAYGIWDMYGEMAKEMSKQIPRTPSGIESYLRKQKLRLQDMADSWLVDKMTKLGVVPWPLLRHTLIRSKMALKIQKKREKKKKSKKKTKK